MTCARWADRMLDRMHSGDLRTRGGRPYKRSSVDTARTQLKPFVAEFGDRDPNTITRVEAEDWAATVNAGAIAIVVQLMNQLDRAEVIDRNRFAGLSKRPVGRRDSPPPTADEMLLLLGACSALGAYAPVMRSLITFAVYTLLRPSELIDLVWENVVGNRVHVMTRYYRGASDLPKPNRTKVIALVPPAREALDQLLQVPGYEPAGYVFRNKTGDRLTAPTLSGYWGQVRARSGLEFDLYHATKHYGVWFLKVRMGLPNSLIAAQAGWSEKSVDKMVETYGHATDDRRLVELDAAFQRDLLPLDESV
jgi:integrase